MTILAQDNFTRPDQAAWGLASDTVNTWSQPVAADTPGGAESWGILSDGGQVLNNGENVMFCGTGTAITIECQGTFYLTNSSSWGGVTLRSNDDATICYQCILANANGLYIVRRVTGLPDTYDEDFPDHPTVAIARGDAPNYSGHLMHVKFRCNYTGLSTALLLGKAWIDGVTEPDWIVGITDNSPISSNIIPGRFGVYLSPNVVDDDKCFSFLATDTLTGNEPDGDEGGGGGGSTSLASIGNGKFGRVA